MRNIAFLASFVPAVLLIGGCDDSGLGEVSGTVTLDGAPLPDALVEFIPDGGDGGVSFGRTDSNGEYYLMRSRTSEGANLGENTVRITTRDILDDGGNERWVPEKVPRKYNTQTELTFVVESGSNAADFDLSTAGSKIDQPAARRSGF